MPILYTDGCSSADRKGLRARPPPLRRKQAQGRAQHLGQEASQEERHRPLSAGPSRSPFKTTDKNCSRHKDVELVANEKLRQLNRGKCAARTRACADFPPAAPFFPVLGSLNAPRRDRL
ncbi:hypothetical protein HPB48_020708 [Haemaphysalis longicornis]|uniref:Uncharacterized protein n=1 Tax=Haemaphysalis longicornis TaxID=44386 RepID=A0A9J6G7K6_HAELO|nr:hypothetical protein HPB48_020708 [Haemaphysalis longicornis]